MKQTTGKTLKLGIIVSLSIALFIIGIYFIGQKQQLFSSTFHISGTFRDISGLKIGNNVRFSGINVGVIEGIQQITDSTVRVDMIIDEDTRRFIKRNAKAIITADGLMGDKFMSIIPGRPGEASISNRDTIETAQAVSMDDILLSLKVTADNAAVITGDLAAIMENIHDGNGTIGKLFMDNDFADNLDQTLINIREGTGGFKENMDAASHSILLRGHLKKQDRAKAKKDKAKAKEEAENEK